MKISTLQDKKLDELREIARELDLTGYSDLRKQDLIYRILEAQAEGAASGEEPDLNETGPSSTPDNGAGETDRTSSDASQTRSS
ncbi:Rho termination factor N-terminal domain-containing protein, partial [Salinibacter ruber]